MKFITYLLSTMLTFGTPHEIVPTLQTESCHQCVANTQAIESLAEAVYFEARSEPREGQIAVAYVIMNRVQSGKFPSNVDGVINQNCQFSYTCDSIRDTVTDKDAYQDAVEAATLAYYKKVPDPVYGAMYYKNDKVSKQKWKLAAVRKIGNHTFYTPKA